MTYFKYDACEYDKWRGKENIPFWVQEAIRLAELDSNSLILDLGCGSGKYAIRFVEAAHGTVYGLDPSVEMVKVGKLKSSSNEIAWLCGVAEYISFISERFDCIFSSQVWHHIQDQPQAARECYRVLKGNSPLIIRTVSHDQWREKPVCTFFPEILPGQLTVYPSMTDFEEYLGKAGFTDVKILPYRFERYEQPEIFIEAAEKKLWSMFKHVSEESLKKGIEKLKNLAGQPIRNDELITLVVGWKS